MTLVAWLGPGPGVLGPLLAVVAQVTTVILVAGVVGRTTFARRAAARHGLWISALALTIAGPAAALVVECTGTAWHIVPWGAQAFEAAPAAQERGLDGRETIALADREGAAPAQIFADRVVPADRARSSSAVHRSEPQPAESELRESGISPGPKNPVAESTNGGPGAVAAHTPGLAARARRPLAGGLMLVWATGVCIGLARLVAGWRSVRELRRSFRPFDAGGCGGVLAEVRAVLDGFALPPIVTTPAVDGPVAIGVWKPVVALPEGLAASLSPLALRDVLVHECAHVRRRDTAVGVLQRLVAALYWPHPLVHQMNAELARAREEVCDNFVLRLGDPCAYARTLLELTERGRPGAWAGVGLGLGGARWTLQDRIAGLLDPRRDAMTEPNRRTAGMAAVALVLLTVSIIAVRPARPLAAQATPAREPAPPERIVHGTVVDEHGQPVAGATVRPVREEKSREAATTAADGRFALPSGSVMFMEEDLLASARDGSLLGLGKHVEREGAEAASPVRIVVRPSQAVTVRVRDKAGKPVVGAAVEAVGFPYHGAATTGPGGEALLRVPADARVRWVIGLKPGAGFDYFENYRARPVFDADLGPLPAELTLTLDGARSVRIKAVDSAGHPVPGAEFLPWLIGKPGKVDQANTSAATIVRARTDERGVATWDWLPAEIDGDVPFLGGLGHYSCAESPVARRGGPSELGARLLRGTVIRGVVHQADGRPAPGILVRAEGRGATTHSCRMQTRTDQDGSYALEVYPEQSYIIAVLDDRRAAPSLTGVAVREGQPRAGLDFTLADGTLIHGSATRTGDGTPAADETVTLVENGRKLPEEYARYPEGGAESLVRWATTNAGGRYRLRVGPGRYTLFAPGHTAREDLRIETEAAIERDFQVAESARSQTVTGMAVEATPAGERPLAGAIVEASPVGGAGLRNRAVADGKGRFHLRANAGKGLVLYVRDRAGALAGFTVLKADAADVRASASPASRIRGRVVNRQRQPQAGRQVQLRLDSGPDYQESGHFFTHAVTDAHGVYEFPAIVVGAYAEVSVPHSPGPRAHGRVELQRLDVRSPDVLEAPDLVVPAQGDKPVEADRPRAGAFAVVPASHPVAPSRSQIEDLVRAVGRDPATPALVDRAWLLTRPQFAWAVDLERVRSLVGDPDFTRRVDEASRAVLGHPADTLTLLKRALSYHVGADAEFMKRLLGRRTPRDSERVPATRGTVVDADTDRPVGGAIVSTSDALARTDGAGAFLLTPSTPQRRGMIWIEADGYALAEYPAGEGDGGAADVRVRLVKDAPVVGRVVGAGGRPVAGATVTAWVKHFDFRVPRPDPAPTDDSYGFPLEVHIDPDGRFALRGLPPGLALSWYEVRHPEHQTYRGEPPLKAGESMTLALEPGCKVSGTVVDEQGRPIGGALVSVRSPGRRGDVFTTHTMADGRFRFGGVSPGRWVVVVQPERHAPAIGTVVVSQDRPVENQYVVGPGSYISGRVLGSDGEPVPSAAVGWAQPVDGQGRAAEDLALDRMTNTAADGTFRLGPLAQGEYRLTSVADEPRRLGRANTRSNQMDAVIRLEADSRQETR